MRKSIIKNAFKRQSVDAPAEVVGLLADRLECGLHELQGVVNYLVHYCETLGKPLTSAAAKKALADQGLLEPERTPTPAEIVKAVASTVGVGDDVIRRKNRSPSVSYPRMLAVYLARKLTKHTYAEIGRSVGSIAHSTAISGEKKIREALKADGEMTINGERRKVVDLLDAIERKLKVK
jgi:chromosomal replication initiator protein